MTRTPKRFIFLCCLGAVLLGAFFVFKAPREFTVMAKSEKHQSGGASYLVTVKRWRDHYRGGRYKCRNDRFYVDLFQGRGAPVSSYEFEGEVPITNAVIAWPGSNECLVIFDDSMRVGCAWSDGKPTWERK